MQGPEVAAICRQRYVREEQELYAGKPAALGDASLPRQSGSLEWRQTRGEMGGGVMDSTAGSASIRTSDDVTKLLQQMHSESAKAQTQNHAPKPIKKEESTAVIAPRLPQRPAAELFEEAKAKRSQIKQLTEQIQYGCKNASCQNSACCLSANSSLHSQLGISNAADKS